METGDSGSATGGATSGSATDSAPEAASTGESASQSGGQSALNTGSQPVANQPTKSELRELGDQDMDAMVTMKVNGKSEKMTVRQALKQAELGQGAHQKMQEAANMRREITGLLQLLKTDPDAFFEKTGMDADAYAEKRLIAKYEKMAMTPEQRKMSELEAYKAQMEKEKAERSKTEEQRNQEHAEQRERDVITKEFTGAWKESGLPHDPLFGQWMASAMYAANVQKDQGLRDTPLTASEAAASVREGFTQAVKSITEKMDPQAIHQLLGEATVKRLREFDVAKVTGKTAPQFGQKGPGQSPPASKSKTNSVTEKGWKQIFQGIS